MLKAFTYFEMAAKLTNAKQRKRDALLGAIGIRGDGTVVCSINGHTYTPEPKAHAEARLCKKLDSNAVVYVARVTKNGEFAMAKPCESCMLQLRAKRVKRIYYTTGPRSYEVQDL